MSRCALCLLLLGGLLPTLALGQVDPEDYPEMLERVRRLVRCHQNQTCFQNPTEPAVEVSVLGWDSVDWILPLMTDRRELLVIVRQMVLVFILATWNLRTLEYERQISPVSISK